MEILAVETDMEGVAGLHTPLPFCLHDLQVLFFLISHSSDLGMKNENFAPKFSWFESKTD